MVWPPFLALKFFVRCFDRLLRIGLPPARGSQPDAEGHLDLFAVIGIFCGEGHFFCGASFRLLRPGVAAGTPIEGMEKEAATVRITKINPAEPKGNTLF